LSAKSNRKKSNYIYIDIVTVNNCVLVQSLLALEMIPNAAMNLKVAAPFNGPILASSE